MNILIIGQTSLHWGRMEYGNIGNYYIIEPLIRQLHRVFEHAKIYTTLQMSDEFCQKERIARVPLDLYYSWDDEHFIDKCIYEYGIAEIFDKTGILKEYTPFIKEVLKADLVIDFSGDIWSDNADFVGPDRFLIGLLKNRVAQLLGKKTVMLSGSPSPFNNHNHQLTKEVFESFNLVTNREQISTQLLEEYGFNINHVKSFACPAFIFEPFSNDKINNLIKKYSLDSKVFKTGFILCGWNLEKGPYDRIDIHDSELMSFVELIEDHSMKRNSTIYLISHSNGFDLPPDFRLKHGRDFPFAKQVYRILKSRNVANTEKICLVSDVMAPKEIKAFIGNLDMLISGRIHGAVAGLSQSVPTVILDYGHEPKAHKLKGFAEIAGVEEYVADPTNKNDMFNKVENCYASITLIRSHLDKRMKIIKQMVNESFDILKDVIGS